MSRYVISAICLALCIILTIASIEGIHAKDVSDNSTFEQRLNYDVLVFHTQGNKSLDSIKNIEGVEQAEQVGISTGTLTFNGQEQTVQVNAIQNNSQLITPRDKYYNILTPQNGIIIEEYLANAFKINIGDYIDYEGKKIQVTEIAREFIHPIQYISLETATSLDIKSNNAATVKINPSFDTKEIYNKIYDADGVEYIKFVEHQHDNRGIDMESIYIIYYLLCIACLVIGVVTIFNMIRIKIGETIYEYSTLMSIGTKYSSIRFMTIYENIVQYILAVIIAIVPAYFVTKLILDKQSSFRGSYPIVDLPQVYLIALCLCLIYVVLGVAYTMFKVYRLKLSETINIAE